MPVPFKRLVHKILGLEIDPSGIERQVAIGPESGVYASANVLDPVLIRNIEVASRPTISPSPIFVLKLQNPADVPWTDLDLGPWTADPQNPVPGSKGVAASAILYVSVAGSGGVIVRLRRKAATQPAETYEHGAKFDFLNSIMVLIALDSDQLVQYQVSGKGTVEVRFIGYFDRPRVTP